MSGLSITELIPHRAPMLLVDEVLSCDPQSIVCAMTFHPDDFFVQGHYPGYPMVPGVILCECAAQSSAILLAKHHVSAAAADQVPVLTRMNNVRFKRTVHPGDKVEIAVKLDEELSGAFFLSAVVRRDAKIVASLDLACTLAPRA